jgi:hypothetical protein
MELTTKKATPIIVRDLSKPPLSEDLFNDIVYTHFKARKIGGKLGGCKDWDFQDRRMGSFGA